MTTTILILLWIISILIWIIIYIDSLLDKKNRTIYWLEIDKYDLKDEIKEIKSQRNTYKFQQKQTQKKKALAYWLLTDTGKDIYKQNIETLLKN